MIQAIICRHGNRSTFQHQSQELNQNSESSQGPKKLDIEHGCMDVAVNSINIGIHIDQFAWAVICIEKP